MQAQLGGEVEQIGSHGVHSPVLTVSPLFAEDIAMSLTFRDFRDHDFCEIIILIFAMILIARYVQHIHYQIYQN